MPGLTSGSNTNMWYSFDYANIHFVSISTETGKFVYPNFNTVNSEKKLDFVFFLLLFILCVFIRFSQCSWRNGFLWEPTSMAWTRFS